MTISPQKPPEIYKKMTNFAAYLRVAVRAACKRDCFKLNIIWNGLVNCCCRAANR